MKNMLCAESVLTNEASVEYYFANRLILELGYKDNQILIKPNIDEIQISLGSNKVWYKPDYILKRPDRTMWVLEAKSPKETNLKNHIGQSASYCLMINGGYEESNPIEYFVITNGLKTCLYRWDCHKAPLLELDFEEIYEENPKFQSFKKLLSPNSVKLNIEVTPVSFEEKIKIDPTCGSIGFLLTSNDYINGLENINDYNNISRVHLLLEEKMENNLFQDDILDNDVTVIEGIDGSNENVTPTKNLVDVITADLRTDKVYSQERELKLRVLDKYEPNLRISEEVKVTIFERFCSLLKSGGILSLVLNIGFLEKEKNKEVRDFIYQKFNLISYLPYNLIDKESSIELSILILRKK